MSFITEVTIHCDHPDSLIATEPGGMGSRAGHESNKLVALPTRYSGGSKVYCSELLIGAYNYLEVDTFIEWVRDTVEGDAFLIIDTEGEVRVLQCFGGNIIELGPVSA